MRSKTLASVILLAALMTISLPVWKNWQTLPPDFSLYPAGEARKTAFFSYLGPLVDQENARWQRDRERLKGLKAASVDREKTAKQDMLWLEARSRFFGVETDQPQAQLVDALLRYVDQVPRSLALAQAAKESAWGTSRFATDGFNYFGQRCYQKGCGLVPQARAQGAKFEVRRFESPQASVASYMNNINSHPDYEGFRTYRAEQRAAGRPVHGIQAAERLTQYSERRQAYVDEIQSLIHFNRLEKQAESAPSPPAQPMTEQTTL